MHMRCTALGYGVAVGYHSWMLSMHSSGPGGAGLGWPTLWPCWRAAAVDAPQVDLHPDGCCARSGCFVAEWLGMIVCPCWCARGNGTPIQIR